MKSRSVTLPKTVERGSRHTRSWAMTSICLSFPLSLPPSFLSSLLPRFLSASYSLSLSLSLARFYFSLTHSYYFSLPRLNFSPSLFSLYLLSTLNFSSSHVHFFFLLHTRTYTCSLLSSPTVPFLFPHALLPHATFTSSWTIFTSCLSHLFLSLSSRTLFLSRFLSQMLFFLSHAFTFTFPHT